MRRSRVFKKSKRMADLRPQKDMYRMEKAKKEAMRAKAMAEARAKLMAMIIAKEAAKEAAM